MTPWSSFEERLAVTTRAENVQGEPPVLQESKEVPNTQKQNKTKNPRANKKGVLKGHRSQLKERAPGGQSWDNLSDQVNVALKYNPEYKNTQPWVHTDK